MSFIYLFSLSLSLYIYIYMYILKWISQQRDLYYSNYSFCFFLHMFLASSYLQRIFDNFGWFLVSIVVTVLVGFSVRDFLQVMLLSFSFFFLFHFLFPKACLVFFEFFFLWLVFDIWYATKFIGFFTLGHRVCVYACVCVGGHVLHCMCIV